MNKIIINNKFVHLLLYYWVPFLIWAIVIFTFSSGQAPVVSGFHLTDFIVKKTIHIMEYWLFAILLYRALKESGMENKRSLIYAFIFSVIYGATDEFHQAYTPGREPRMRDVFIDGVGASIAVASIIKILPESSKSIQDLAKKLKII